MNSIEPQIQTQPRYAYVQDDEIDLIGLFAIIWDGKWFVFGITIIAAVIAYFVISLLPPVFLISARINENSEYEIQAIQPSSLEKGEAYQIAPLSTEKLYLSVLAQVDSFYVKKTFWEYQAGESLGDFNESRGLSENQERFIKFDTGISVGIADQDEQNPLLATVSLESEDPVEGMRLLNGFMSYIDQNVVAKSLGQLEAGFDAGLDRLENDYQNLKERELVKVEDKLIRLGEARDLAKSLDIVETPYDQVENVESDVLNNRLYLLGTRTLTEEIKSLKSRTEKPLQAFVPKLRSMELWKQQMERDLKQIQTNKGKIKAFVVVTPAEASFKPVKPNKMLLFVASVFAAGVLSLILVFILHGVRVYKARIPANG